MRRGRGRRKEEVKLSCIFDKRVNPTNLEGWKEMKKWHEEQARIQKKFWQHFDRIEGQNLIRWENLKENTTLWLNG